MTPAHFRIGLAIAVASIFSSGNLHSEIVWSDEFEGDVIDTSTWTYDVGGWGFGNGQMEFDTARPENSYVENGNLVIEARREYYSGNSFTSARMLTQGRFAFRYGSLEARIKVPDTADGLWPAFWLLGNNFPGIDWPGAGEVDVLELGSSQGIAEGLQQRKINCALHFSNAVGQYSNQVAWLDADVDLNLDYHLYKLEWTPTDMTFFLDGVPYASWSIASEEFSEFHQPFFPILNIAVGGWNPSYTGVYSPGAVTAAFPAKMYVDWIRLSSNDDTEQVRGDSTEENGNFGVFTETTPVDNSLVYEDGSDPAFEYGAAAALYPWNNMTAAPPATASEGTESWSFDILGGNWFGMGVFLPNFRNMKNYSDGYLHVDLKTASTAAMKIGVKSSRGGEFWLPVGDETSEFGFPRDNAWHEVRIPLNRFANIDFHTIHQIFMIAGDPPSQGFNLSIDNVWWEPTGARPTPESGDFGVFTETASHRTAGAFALGVEGEFFVWENTLVGATQDPYEGGESLSFGSAPGLAWFGAAFTPNLKFDLTAFRHPESRLRFAMKTSSPVTFMIGMKSGNVDGIGQKWISFASGSDPYGFARDGQWHVIEIPVSEIATEVNLSEVSQLFQVLGVSGPISDIEFDDIHFTNGGSSRQPVTIRMTKQGNDAELSFLSDHLTNYRVVHKDNLTDPHWTVRSTLAGDGTEKTVTDPLSLPRQFYLVETIR